LTAGFFLLSKGGLAVKAAIMKKDNERLPWLWQVDGSGILGWRFQLCPALSFETAGISRFPATTARFPAAAPLLGDHLRLSRAGCVIYVPRHLLFVSTGVNYFLSSGGLGVGVAKGMSKVRMAK
jgi:hypothetical protein